ncbi:ABC transporter ATP-binding protein [Chelativorans sp. Marseille-P2723]|uniref:ABC transporter ATP-binding protein n=1 Tax=Chelativorans sp. Marseille-P2723 TaxID=2709133 RepID=UPI00156F475F|nr:ABC transporter ATP-binding protein [Chelativorans sp. Marseille-P2723]
MSETLARNSVYASDVVREVAAQSVSTIEVRGLMKRFRRSGGGEVVPVNDVNLTVGQQEMVVLLGPSGCGKTTLLRCVAGLERPDSGEISIAGELVYSSARETFLPPNRRPASMIFQSYALWPHMSVHQNVAYPLEARGMKRSDIDKRVSRTLQMVGLAGLEASHPGQISGGQQQRVALARAVVGDSRVILFDEPLSNVDAKVREQLRLEIRSMQKRLGFSGLYVTHDQTEAMAIADRIAVIDRGRIVQLADPETIYDNPASLYVADFVGTANTWAGTVVGCEAGKARVDTAFGPVEAVCDKSGQAPANGARVTLMCRPERISLLAQGENAANTVQAKVIAREFLGAHREILVEAGGTMLRVWADRRQQLSEGETVTLSLDPEFVLLFSAEGGRRQ